MAFMKRSVVCMMAPSCVMGGSQQLWPFSPSDEQQPVHGEVISSMERFGTREPTVIDLRTELTTDPLFTDKVDVMCADAPDNEKKQCEEVQGGRLWCAMVARNIGKMKTLKDPQEDIEKCQDMNEMNEETMSPFLGETWPLGNP